MTINKEILGYLIACNNCDQTSVTKLSCCPECDSQDITLEAVYEGDYLLISDRPLEVLFDMMDRRQQARQESS